MQKLETEDLHPSLIESSSIFVAVVQWLSHVQLFVTPCTTAWQGPLSVTISQGLLRYMSIELVIPSNHLILCHPLLLLPSIFPSIRVFSNESVLCVRWPKYWSFSFSTSSSCEYSGLIFQDWLALSPCCPRDCQESSPALQLESINSSVLRLLLQKAMTAHSSTLAWKTPWTEEPGGLQSMGC